MAITLFYFLKFPVFLFSALCSSFLFKAKKAAMTNLTQTPAPPPNVPRLVQDVVPDERDDPIIILNTTTVSY